MSIVPAAGISTSESLGVYSVPSLPMFALQQPDRQTRTPLLIGYVISATHFYSSPLSSGVIGRLTARDPQRAVSL